MELFEAHSFYVPFFRITVDGKSLDPVFERDVTQITYRDSLEKMDQFEITINNWDAEKKTARYIGPGVEEEKDLYEPGKQLEVFMGYYPTHAPKTRPLVNQRMLIGEITTLAVNLPAAGQPTLRVSGQNILRRLLIKQETYDYEGLTDTKIAKAVFARGNLRDVEKLDTDRADPSSEAEREFVKQDNQFDIIFIMGLARHSGYDLILEERGTNGKKELVLVFGISTKRGRAKTYELEWGKSLVEFQPTLTVVDQVGEVTVRGWNPDTKREIVGKAKLSDLDSRALRDLERQGRLEKSFSQRTFTEVEEPIHTVDEAKKRAKAKLEELAKQTVTCSGETVGFPELRAGTEVGLGGLGNTFDGRYILTATTHTIGNNGYRTKFEARKEERR